MLRVVSVPLLVFIFAIVSFAGILGIFGKVSLMNVVSNSMVPTFQKGDLIAVSKNYNDIAIGDVIVFSTGEKMVVHRIVEMSDSTILTKGDNNIVNDDPIDVRAVQGEVFAVFPKMGWVLSREGVLLLGGFAAFCVVFNSVFDKKFGKDAHAKEDTGKKLDNADVSVDVLVKKFDEFSERFDTVPRRAMIPENDKAGSEELRRFAEIVESLRNDVRIIQERQKFSDGVLLSIVGRLQNVENVSKNFVMVDSSSRSSVDGGEVVARHSLDDSSGFEVINSPRRAVVSPRHAMLTDENAPRHAKNVQDDVPRRAAQYFNDDADDFVSVQPRRAL